MLMSNGKFYLPGSDQNFRVEEEYQSHPHQLTWLRGKSSERLQRVVHIQFPPFTPQRTWGQCLTLRQTIPRVLSIDMDVLRWYHDSLLLLWRLKAPCQPQHQPMGLA
jgi:hypothetical protein